MIGRVFDVLGETRRVPPRGALKTYVGLVSVIAAFLVTYMALYGIATQHLQISLFLVLLLPICFLTTTISNKRDHQWCYYKDQAIFLWYGKRHLQVIVVSTASSHHQPVDQR
jgi:hypothetical protein